MKTLAEALLARGASGEDLVNAEVCQRRLGGSLDTNLLELGLCTEAEMEQILSWAQDLPLPPETLFKGVSTLAADLFPKVLAERYGLAPLGIWEKRLALLVRHPIDLTAIDEISFLLSRPVRLFAGTELRQREVFAAVYGIPLPPRFSRLRARLERRRSWAGEIAAASPLVATPVAVDPSPESATVETPAAEPPAVERPRVETAPAAPTTSDAATAEADAGPLALRPATVLSVIEQADPVESAEVISLTSGWAGRARITAEPPTMTATLEDLRNLTSRDALIGAALRFFLVAFDFVAFFGRRGSQMTVFEASGVDFGGADISHSVVSLDRPSSLRTVVEGRASYVGSIAPGDPLESSLANLGRSRLRAVLLSPVVVRDRTVAVVYGDRGGEALAPSQLSDVALVVSRLGAALERVLKAKNRNGVAPVVELPPKAEDYPRLVRRFLSGDASARQEAARRLTQGGRAAAEALAERFPGPLYVLRAPPPELPAPSDFGPLVALMVSLGPDALPIFEWLSRYSAGERRFWAGAILVKLRQQQPDSTAANEGT